MNGAATRGIRPSGGGTPSGSRLVLGALVVALLGIGATVYLQFLRERNPSVASIEPTRVDPFTDEPLAENAPPPVIDMPIEEPPAAADLPLLDESDGDVLGWLTELFGPGTVAELIVPERLIRNVVVTVDNLTRQQVVPQQRPLKPIPGGFITGGTEDDLFIAPANYQRYAAVMLLIRNTDPRTLAALYGRFRPLFQQAYEELGYPSRSFHQRLTQVIDHLLTTPDVSDPIALVQPRVMYQYADPELEKLSAGQKLLLRMGRDNAAVIKAKLRELRADLTQY